MMKSILWKVLVTVGTALAVRKLDRILRASPDGKAPAWAKLARQFVGRGQPAVAAAR